MVFIHKDIKWTKWAHHKNIVYHCRPFAAKWIPCDMLSSLMQTYWLAWVFTLYTRIIWKEDSEINVKRHSFSSCHVQPKKWIAIIFFETVYVWHVVATKQERQQNYVENWIEEIATIAYNSITMYCVEPFITESCNLFHCPWYWSWCIFNFLSHNLEL